MNWEDGLQDEIDFWRGVLINSTGEAWKFDGTNQVHPSFAEVLLEKAKKLGVEVEGFKAYDNPYPPHQHGLIKVVGVYNGII